METSKILATCRRLLDQQTEEFKVLRYSEIVPRPPDSRTFWETWDEKERMNHIVQRFGENSGLDHVASIPDLTYSTLFGFLTYEQAREFKLDWFSANNIHHRKFTVNIKHYHSGADVGQLYLRLSVSKAEPIFSYKYKIKNIFGCEVKVKYVTELDRHYYDGFESRLKRQLLQCVRAFVPLVDCMVFIQGDADGDPKFETFFARDLHLANAIAKIGNEILPDSDFRQYYPHIDGCQLVERSAMRVNGNPDLLFRCVFRDISCEELKEKLKLILGAHSLGKIAVMYAGHGNTSGEWILRDGDSFCHEDFVDCLPSSFFKPDLQVTLFPNNCYSHLFCDDENTLWGRGVWTIPATSFRNPLCPLGGIVEVLDECRRKPETMTRPATEMVLNLFLRDIDLSGIPSVPSSGDRLGPRLLKRELSRPKHKLQKLRAGMYVIRCGTGDSILLVDEDSHALLIDGGPIKHAKDTLCNLLKRIASYNILITHADQDHVAMPKALVMTHAKYPDLLPNLRVIFANIPESERRKEADNNVRSIEELKDLYGHMKNLKVASASEDDWYKEIKVGSEFSHGLNGFELTVVNPSSTEALYNSWFTLKRPENSAITNHNYYSVSLIVEREGKKVLLTADSSLQDRSGQHHGKYDLIQIPHHGSENNSRADDWRKFRSSSFFVSGSGRHGLPKEGCLNALPRNSHLYPTFLTDGVRGARHHVNVLYQASRFNCLFYGFDDAGMKAVNVTGEKVTVMDCPMLEE